jgi:tRNA 2-thiouridine synthesizing protein A
MQWAQTDGVDCETTGEKAMDIDMELDTSGLNCPLPILKAKRVLANLHSGQILRIIATDPDSVKDFEAFSKQSSHDLLESQQEGDKFYFLLRKI